MRTGVKPGWLELGMAGTLLGSFLMIPVFWVHIVLGVVGVLLASLHVALRRHVYLSVLRRCSRRATCTGALIVSAVVVTVSGFVQWSGVLAAIPWHGASSILLILLGAGHGVRRAVRNPIRNLSDDEAH